MLKEQFLHHLPRALTSAPLAVAYLISGVLMMGLLMTYSYLTL